MGSSSSNRRHSAGSIAVPAVTSMDRPVQEIARRVEPDIRAHLLSACTLSSAWAVYPPSCCTLPSSQPLPEHDALPMAITEMRSVAVAIQTTLSELRGNAVSAISDASALRDAAIASGSDSATINAAYAALVSEVERVEAGKAAALEAELVEEDALLERAESVLGAVASAARSLSAEGLKAERAALFAQLDELFDALRASPRGPVEEPTLLVVAPPEALATGDCNSAACEPRLAMLITRHVAAAELTMVLPRRRHARPDSAITVLLLLPQSSHSDIREGGSFGLTPSLAQASLMQRVDARATLSLSGSMNVAIAPRFAPYEETTSGRRGVSVAFVIPADTPIGSRVRIESVSVARESVLGPVGDCVIQVSLHVGLSAPFRLRGAGGDYQTPCVTSDGMLAIPARSAFEMYGSSGVMAKQPRIDHSETCAVAHIADGDILIARGSDFVVAFDLATETGGVPRTIWRHGGDHFGCGSVVALAEAGIVVFADYYGNNLVALRLCDGTVAQKVPMTRPIYATAGPPGSCTLYASSETDGLVCSVQFDALDPTRTAMLSHPLLPARISGYGSSPLAVMPPAPGKAVWHLIVGGYGTPLLVVLALPGGEEVGRIEGSAVDPTAQYVEATETDLALYWGSRIRGLAADLAGGALVVTSGSDVFAVPWPPSTMLT